MSAVMQEHDLDPLRLVPPSLGQLAGWAGPGAADLGPDRLRLWGSHLFSYLPASPALDPSLNRALLESFESLGLEALAVAPVDRPQPVGDSGPLPLVAAAEPPAERVGQGAPPGNRLVWLPTDRLSLFEPGSSAVRVEQLMLQAIDSADGDHLGWRAAWPWDLPGKELLPARLQALRGLWPSGTAIGLAILVGDIEADCRLLRESGADFLTCIDGEPLWWPPVESDASPHATRFSVVTGRLPVTYWLPRAVRSLAGSSIGQVRLQTPLSGPGDILKLWMLGGASVCIDSLLWPVLDRLERARLQAQPAAASLGLAAVPRELWEQPRGVSWLAAIVQQAEAVIASIARLGEALGCHQPSELAGVSSVALTAEVADWTDRPLLGA
jgi:hypothetical protein